MVEQVPQANGDEAGAGQDVIDAVPRRAAHGSSGGGCYNGAVFVVGLMDCVFA
jgi:hypothetical protein